MRSQPSKFTLLRRYKENDIIEPADIAIERMATDAELEGVWRNPQRWSYVVRSPSLGVRPAPCRNASIWWRRWRRFGAFLVPGRIPREGLALLALASR
jgi:hypothetical protein